ENGTLFINGTSGADTVTIAKSDAKYVVTRAGDDPDMLGNFDIAKVNSIQVDLGDGNDVFSAGPGVPGLYVNGGLGDDIISGGDGNDTLTGAAGKDRIDG